MSGKHTGIKEERRSFGKRDADIVCEVDGKKGLQTMDLFLRRNSVKMFS